MSQEVSPHPLTPEARVYHWDVKCGICGRVSGTKKRFSPITSNFLCQYHSTKVQISFLFFFYSGRLMVLAINDDAE
jgi:hypothetical protein